MAGLLAVGHRRGTAGAPGGRANLRRRGDGAVRGSARPAPPAVVLDRQRRLDGPGPVDGGRGSARRFGPRPGRHRGRRRAGRARQRHRPARPAEHDVGLHAGRDLPDAAGAAVHRPHLARLQRGASRHGRRLRRRHQRFGRRGERLPGTRRQPREARLPQRGGLARGARARAGGAGRGSRNGRAGARPGRGRPAVAPVALRARRARLPDDRDAPRVRRRHGSRPRRGARQPRPPVDRGLHGRGQRRDGEVPPGPGLSVDPPRGAVARALGPAGGAGRPVRRAPAARARFARALRLPHRAARRRPGPLSRPLALGHQAARRRRIRRRSGRTRRAKGISAWP